MRVLVEGRSCVVGIGVVCAAADKDSHTAEEERCTRRVVCRGEVAAAGAADARTGPDVMPGAVPDAVPAGESRVAGRRHRLVRPRGSTQAADAHAAAAAAAVQEGPREGPDRHRAAAEEPRGAMIYRGQT